MSLYTSTVSMSYLYTDVHMQPWHLAQLWNLLAVGGTITGMAQNSNPQGRLDAGSPIPDILWLGNTKGSKDGWRIDIYYHLLYFVNPDAKNDIYYSWFCLQRSSKILLLTPQNFGRDLSSWILLSDMIRTCWPMLPVQFDKAKCFRKSHHKAKPRKEICAMAIGVEIPKHNGGFFEQMGKITRKKRGLPSGKLT